MIGNSQSEILKHLLYQKDALSIDDLSKLLEISRNATYLHVKSLEGEGLIKAQKVERTKGRPTQKYSLTRAGRATFQKSYGMLATLFMHAVKEEMGGDAVTTIFKRLGADLAASSGKDVTTMPLTERIERINEILNSLGYETTLSADEKTVEGMPEILANNCIFHEAADKHPEVCAMDIQFLESLSSCDVEHVECLVRGGSHCRFKFMSKT
jgi:predicted ArsR family transcriptional regulator